ncbi:hypothetical protein HNQ34_003522 [Anoxybacillus tepidamans]|uniref:Uncharacterized protein n=1 Tax=Anoxybacteroides tepidamans TaxID=265948 RepID=A0A7W8MWG3_9BACL|nr:hypothetical protein [Anoxybacillus tepidamans]MBB5326369.1 hypothetical protein [Anoxybacillus tepidamans]
MEIKKAIGENLLFTPRGLSRFVETQIHSMALCFACVLLKICSLAKQINAKFIFPSLKKPLSLIFLLFIAKKER